MLLELDEEIGGDLLIMTDGVDGQPDAFARAATSAINKQVINTNLYNFIVNDFLQSEWEINFCFYKCSEFCYSIVSEYFADEKNYKLYISIIYLIM